MKFEIGGANRPSRNAVWITAGRCFEHGFHLKEDSLCAGTVIDGKILRGQTYFAGELLHMEYSGKSVRELLRSGREGVIDVATHQVVNISALINPAVIVFTGNNISAYEIDEIRDGALKYISEDNMPRILYKSHFERYYLQGLAAIALDENNISLSEKYFEKSAKSNPVLPE